jgi:hypothetical protein
MDRHIQPQGSPARQSPPAEDIIHVMIKVSAAERSKFVLGQLLVLSVAIFVGTLVELAIWRAS